MFLQRIIIIFLLTSFFSPSLLAKEHFHYEAYTLENGLQVVILPNARAPVVYHALWYKVGSADSPTDKTGLAHFIEHLMFKGTAKFPGDTFKRTINDLGGIQTANTNQDRTGYFVTIAKEFLAQVMEMEADRMQNLNIAETDLQKEKEVVLQERRQTTDAVPSQRLFEAADAALFWQHPYGKPTIGFEEHIRSYTTTDARNFYKTWYVPNNAILVIAGDVSVKTLKPLIQKYYGQIPKASAITRQRLAEPVHREINAKIELRDPQIGTYFHRIYRAPNHTTTDRKTEASLSLLQDILGDSTFGRLNAALVEGPKIAQSTVATYIGHYLDPYLFSISAAPVNAGDLPLLEASVDAEIRRLIHEGISESELNNIKQQWQFHSRYRLDSLHGLADYFGANLVVGYSLEDLENWLDIIQSVKTEDIQTAAKNILGQAPGVTAYAHQVVQH